MITSFMDGPSLKVLQPTRRTTQKNCWKKRLDSCIPQWGQKVSDVEFFIPLWFLGNILFFLFFISAFSALVALSENLDFLKVTFFKKASTGWTRHRKFKKFMSLRITDLQKFWCDFIKPHWEISRIWPRSCLDYLL